MRVLGHAFAALLALAALPAGAGALLIRPRWWLGLPERLGAQPRLAPGSVWIHAAAVGEMRAASRLAERLLGHGRAVCTTATNGPGWTNSTGWVATPTPCSWYGVTCAGGSVTDLNLNGNLLVGTIPTGLGALTNLTGLQLPNNQLSGSIPADLGTLTKNRVHVKNTGSTFELYATPTPVQNRAFHLLGLSPRL